jgi:ribose transport system ATP-binding protein
MNGSDGVSEQASQTLISIEHVSKTFPGQRALADVSFVIEHGEIHALVGENGSGKSTLIKTLSGFHEADPGSRISVAGEPLTFGTPSDAHRRGLRFVHQDLGLIDQLTGAENIGLASGFTTGRAGRINRGAHRRHAEKLLARIGVEMDLEVPVNELRPVDRSALAIARALDDAHGAITLLVLDEPTAALPPAECAALFAVLREVVAGGVSILYVSHRLDEVLSLADHVTVLRDGHCQGTLPAEGVDRTRLAELIVGQNVEMKTQASAGVSHTRPAEGRAPEPVLQVHRLHCETINQVAFDVHPGEVLAVAGLSGSGRELLAGAVCGAVPAFVDLTLDGRTLTGEMTPELARELRLALVLPNRHPKAAIPIFTIEENMTLGRVPEFGRMGKIQRRRERAAVDEWIKKLDIRPPDATRQYSMLSGGNQQKVLLAKWFGMDPRVVFMEDPTSGVDIGARYAIYDLIRDHAKTGAGFVICSSDIEDLVAACDRVIALVNGQIVEELTGAEITETAILRAISATASAAA